MFVSDMRQLFLLSGFSRGGTNILWNLICSHPGVLSSGLELNEILGPKKSGIPLSKKAILEFYALSGIKPPYSVSEYAVERIISFSENHAKSSWGKWKFQDTVYSLDEISTLPVCTKSVNSWARDKLFGYLKRNISLKYNQLLMPALGSYKTIYLIREPEAVCNGWMRRGCDPTEAGKWYKYIVDVMIQDYRSRPNDVLFVRFEDVLSNPLAMANRVYEFLGVEPITLEAVHLKSKRILREDGQHMASIGDGQQMTWVPASELGLFLDPAIDSRQKQMLSVDVRNKFRDALADTTMRLNEVLSRT